MSNIAIFGYYGFENAGDEAFKAVFSRHLQAHSISFFSPSTIPQFEPHYDVIIIGGGNVCGDYFFGKLIEKDWQNCQRVDLIGVGLSDSTWIKYLEIFRSNIKNILVRNKSELEKFVVSGFSAEYIPDIVYSLGMSCEKKSNFLRPKVAIINSLEYFPMFSASTDINDLIKLKEVIINLIFLIGRLGQRYDVDLISISRDNAHYDAVFQRILYRSIPEAWRFCRVIDDLPLNESLIGELSEYSCVFSMKYHGLVFAALAGVPFLNLSENIKNNDLMSLYGLNEYNINLQNKIDAELIFEKMETRIQATTDQYVTTELSALVISKLSDVFSCY